MRSIQARRDDPEHFFDTHSEISTVDLNTASDDIGTLVPFTLKHLPYHSLFNKLSSNYKYLNKTLVKPRLRTGCYLL